MSGKRAKEFRRLFKNRVEYRHFKKRYSSSSLPLKLEVLAVVKKTKGKTIMEISNGRE